MEKIEMIEMNTKFLPKSILTRYLALPTDPDDPRAYWVCDQCGPVQPKMINLGGEIRYSKRKCTHQLAEEKQFERMRQMQEWKETMGRHTYTWLGAGYSDANLREYTFDNFTTQHAWQQDALELAKLFVQDLHGTFVAYGSFGTGKTHLLAGICHEILEQKNKSSLFVTAPKLFRAIQQRIGRSEEYQDIMDKAIKTPLLVIDDIDKSKWSEFREEIYFTIVDERVKAKRPIAISTNKLDQLADYVGGAVCSRLKIGQLAAEMVGSDYREEL